ncbi:MAG: hypothetical protein OQJ96_04940, partial [Flavobacteriales bacterium]|nr:hypothetical protein [Flavobacteriales bacterium]MCW8913667.1 hypothetical protein [Flavobacteriales bacterium]MCW8937171.1 hypothetical protein [Flavobacteriales bacterium]MCW8968681.1 hypothetical protein [Flavobacteriales bacterium]MCW8991506.1 hypothetical protein [Flavobacteriales bacterium]
FLVSFSVPKSSTFPSLVILLYSSVRIFGQLVPNDPAMRSAGFEKRSFQICTEPRVYILFLIYLL